MVATLATLFRNFENSTALLCLVNARISGTCTNHTSQACLRGDLNKRKDEMVVFGNPGRSAAVFQILDFARATHTGVQGKGVKNASGR